jgi:hypothetical protein
MCSRQDLVSYIHPPYLHVTYHGIDKLLTPYFKVLFFSNMGIWQQFEQFEDGDLLAQGGCHCWCAIVG